MIIDRKKQKENKILQSFWEVAIDLNWVTMASFRAYQATNWKDYVKFMAALEDFYYNAHLILW